MNKDEIFDYLEDEREKLLEAIDGLSEDAMEQPGVIGDWSVKDILSHLIAWETEVVRLLWQIQQGEKPTILSLSNTPVNTRNQAIYLETRSRSLDRVLVDLRGVRKQTIRRADEFEENELISKKYSSWLGETTLWEWIARYSFQHEAEHTIQILEWRSRNGE